MRRIGLISDTHGLLRPEALAFLRGSDQILHAGDVGDPRVLEALAELAPLTAVRGNCDHGPWASRLCAREYVEVEGVRILVLHDLAALGTLLADLAVVVYGHSHQPKIEEREGVRFVNPGSAGPRRFRLPVSVGELGIEAGRISVRTVPILIQ